MTNDELNRKVAEARGWTSISYNADEQAWYGTQPKTVASDAWIPNYCDDPSAWGALLIEIARERRDANVSITWAFFFHTWHATIGMITRADPSPGRALALAYLASQEARQ